MTQEHFNYDMDINVTVKLMIEIIQKYKKRSYENISCYDKIFFSL